MSNSIEIGSAVFSAKASGDFAIMALVVIVALVISLLIFHPRLKKWLP